MEGPSDDREVDARRSRLQRALLASALLAQGTPMLQAGDELGRTQHGNNNAYCQDNRLSWIDWDAADGKFAEFAAALVALRRALPALRQDRWLDDRPHADGWREVQWLAPARDGETAFRPMALDDWHDARCHALALWLAPRDAAAVLVLMNAEDGPVRFVLPPGGWVQRVDSAHGDLRAHALEGNAVEAPANGLLVLVSEPRRC